MSEVLDFYQQQAKSVRSTVPWLAALQKAAVHELQRFGFPTRHHDDWKYTRVESLLEQRFIPGNKEQLSSITTPKLPFGSQLQIVNGQVFADHALINQLPAGVLVQSLEQAMAEHEDQLKLHLGKVLHHEHGFQALNTAMLGCGVLIYIPAGVRVEQPIVISHWQDEANQAVHYRCLILAEEGSQATIIEDYAGTETSYFTNTVTEVIAAAKANLVHYKIQREAKSAYHIGHLSAQLAANSQFDSHILSLGSKLARSDLSLYLQEQHASCLMNGIYVPTEGQHIDHHTTVYHMVPDCQSEQDYKGILLGRSRAVFNGKVIVAKDAQHTQAKQQNKNLLLSPNAEIDTKPQLEIFADDVICTHGATVGQLDEEALFYLATRGLDREEASSFLIHAFAANNLQLIPDQTLAVWMTTLLNEQLRSIL